MARNWMQKSLKVLISHFQRHASTWLKLAAKNEVVLCDSIRFEKGKKIEGILCRVAGFTPPAAPGRKAKGSAIN